MQDWDPHQDSMSLSSLNPWREKSQGSFLLFTVTRKEEKDKRKKRRGRKDVILHERTSQFSRDNNESEKDIRHQDWIEDSLCLLESVCVF